MGELAKDKDLLIYCRSGRRSDAATRILMEQGYDRVYNVLGGYLAYPKK
jgi:rhodanese-related sulfurtransferase